MELEGHEECVEMREVNWQVAKQLEHQRRSSGMVVSKERVDECDHGCVEAFVEPWQVRIWHQLSVLE
jgi:hypothetical protein